MSSDVGAEGPLGQSRSGGAHYAAQTALRKLMQPDLVAETRIDDSIVKAYPRFDGPMLPCSRLSCLGGYGGKYEAHGRKLLGAARPSVQI